MVTHLCLPRAEKAEQAHCSCTLQGLESHIKMTTLRGNRNQMKMLSLGTPREGLAALKEETTAGNAESLGPKSLPNI